MAGMPLFWNEIRARAITFARDWSGAAREKAEAQTFWNEFFAVFGVRRRTVASFEEPVENLTGDTDFIDLFWKGRLIAEHKSRGKDLSKAHTQAIGYIQSLASAKRTEEIPRYIVVSDFARLALHDLESDKTGKETIQFALADLPEHIREFAFIAGYETRKVDPEDPANVKAVELLGNLHDRLEAAGYVGHDLQRFMVRILFCLFADDTGIFEPDTFKLFVQNRTRPDGSDLGSQLARLFAVLNTPADKRQKTLDEDLAALPYVNGELYAESLGFPEFDAPMRTALLLCCNFKWERISPAIFGSLFQAIMQAPQRRQIGAHYTSERDILKLIRSLFLDDLRAEFDSIKTDKKKLAAFHRKLGQLKFLDPACGCGNFLVVSYRELRRLEMDVLQARFGRNPDEGDIRAGCQLDVSQLFGIEIEEWPVRIAEVALWLMDHQMNAELFARFSQVKATVPLTKSPHIRQANALRLDWNEVLPANECSYVLGNPPFVGKHYMIDQQKDDLRTLLPTFRSVGDLDYVTAWYFKACEYIRNHPVRVAFVSTNSITQGEQASVVWPELFRRFGIKIQFGHRTFRWESEARGKAHVHVVIIGFGSGNGGARRIYDYGEDSENPTVHTVRNISPYLIDASDRVVAKHTTPICGAPPMRCGNKPSDGGHLILTDDEKAELLAREPTAQQYIRPFIGSEELINGTYRWCLWLTDASPADLRRMPRVMERIERVRAFRRKSTARPTQQAASTPGLFFYISQPQSKYIAVPEVSSERRRYIPIGFLSPRVIASNKIYVVARPSLYLFGVLSSSMHMAWVRVVGGRLESRFQYSGSIVYNTFPWPQDLTDKQKARVEKCAQAVLDVRAKHLDATLADLYDPLAMPGNLAKAHADLDRGVDACYRRQPFTSERQRVEYLFALYEKLTAPLIVQPKSRRRAARSVPDAP